MSNQSSWPLDRIVNLDKYPILDLHSPPGRSLVERCRSLFVDGVLCELPEFVRAEAVESVVSTVESKQQRAYLSSRQCGAYSAYAPIHDDVPEPIDPESPHGRTHRRHGHYLALDEFEPGSVIPALYKNRQFVSFVATILGVPVLYPTADPLMGAPVSLHYPGAELGWHCDTQEFTVTVLFRSAEDGGVFQYVPEAAPGNANFDRIPDVFDGDQSLVRAVPIGVGSIVIFRGANTLHRVTPIEGGTFRILSPFHYEQTPNRIYSDEFKQNLFGRTKPLAA